MTSTPDPNYSSLSSKELREHISQNHTDDAAIEELVTRSKDAPTYPAGLSEEQADAILRNKLNNP